MQLGILYGIGVGPGDSELITLKGWKLLKNAQIVAFPQGIKGKPGIAESIIAPWLTEQQEKLPLSFPYVQDEDVLQQAWQEAATIVWQYLSSGRDVVFACEGDVNFYSTFTYLAQTLSKTYPETVIQTIPGICSPMAAVASLGLPLTVKSQRLAIIPTLYRLEELETVLWWAEVIVLMKVSSVYEQVWQILSKHKLLERAWIVERATLPNQVIYDNLSSHPKLELSYFSLLIVHTR